MAIVHVVIVTFNRAEYLRKCLEALRVQSHPIARVTVVNNCSDDHTSDVLNDVIALGMPLTEYRTDRNLGGAGGFSLAFSLAKKQSADWVWVMDDDVAPDQDCLAQLLQASSGYAVVQPNRYYEKNEFVGGYRKVNMGNPFKGLLQAQTCLSMDRKDENIEIGFFPFEGPLIQQKIINDLDLPCAEYFLFCDDVEYSVRVTKSGGKICLCGNAQMRRMIRPVADRNFSWRNYFDFRNRIWLDRTHAGHAFALIRGVLWSSRQWASCVWHKRDMMSYKIVWHGTKDGIMHRKRSLDDLIKEFGR